MGFWLNGNDLIDGEEEISWLALTRSSFSPATQETYCRLRTAILREVKHQLLMGLIMKLANSVASPIGYNSGSRLPAAIRESSGT